MWENTRNIRHWVLNSGECNACIPTDIVLGSMCNEHICSMAVLAKATVP